MKTYYLLRIASWLTRVFPVRTGYWLCSLVGGLIFYFSPGVRDAVMDNMLHLMPDASKRKRKAMARRVIRNVVKNYYDLVRLPYLDKNKLEHKITVYGIEHLDNAVAAKKGFIVISGHIGNFSLVAQMAAARGYPMSIVAEDIQPPKLYDYVNRLRSRFGLKLIKMGSLEVRLIYKLLRNGEGLMLAQDRDVNDTGVPVKFFDAIADLPPGPVALALRLKVPLIPVHTTRLPNNSNVVTIFPPLELERTGDNDLDLQVNLRRVTQLIEEMILKAPDQWVVLQRVWDRDYTGVTRGQRSGVRD